MKWPLSAFADEADSSVDGQIAALQRAGIDRVDLRNVEGTSIVELPLDQAEQVRKKLDAANITVQMYGSPIGKIDIADDVQIDLDRLNHLGALKDILGCRAVRMFSYFNKAEWPHDKWQAETINRMKQLIEIADKHGLVLYHENERHIFGDLIRDVAVLRDECHKPHPDRFKMIFDFDNYNQSGEDVWAAYQELGETTEAIHLKESRKQPDGKYFHVPVGTGDCQVQRILQEFANRNWTGPVTLEPHLIHSGAVMATGPGGQANESFKQMKPEEAFQIAAEHGIGLLKNVGCWD